MRRSLGFALTTCVCVFVVSACGSSGSSSGGKGQEYVDAMMKSYDASSSSTKDVFTRSQAQCLSEGVVDAVGADTLQKAGIAPDDVAKSGNNPFKEIGKSLNDQQAQDLVAVITDGSCFDFTDLVIKQAEQGSGSNPFSKLSKTQTRCLFEKLLANKAFKQAMADSILGKSSSSSAFSQAFGSQSEVVSIFGKCNISPSEISG